MTAIWTCPNCGLTVRLGDADFPFRCPGPQCGFVAAKRSSKPPRPGPLRRARNLLRSVAAGIRAGAFPVSPETQAARLALCRACPVHYDATAGVCTHPSCGCLLRSHGLLNKVAWSHERCPIGRWEPVAQNQSQESASSIPTEAPMVRAKFKVESIERSKYGGQEMQTIKLSPVYPKQGDPNDENAKFYAATPSGSIQLGTVNPEAGNKFELGKEYYVEFTPATS